MPRLTQARVKPFTGEIYFLRPEAYGEFDLVALRHILGLSGDGSHGGGDDDPGHGGDDDPSHDRSFLSVPTLPRPRVRATVINYYTGPVIAATGVFPPPFVRALVHVGGPGDTVGRALPGHPIMVYSIPQIVQVTYPASLSNGGIFLDNYPLNRTDFRLVRGIQNEIRFYVRDVDRKPVPVGFSETLTINMVDLATNTLLMSRDLTVLDSAMGVYLLTVYPSEMDAWPTTTAVRWSLSYTRDDGSTVLMWTDRAYSPYSTLTITEGPVPGPAPTTTFAWGEFANISGVLYSPSLGGSSRNGFIGGVQTFMFNMTGFSGTIRIDGSLVANPVNNAISTDWFQVDVHTYSINSAPIVLNETGNYTWMRLVVTPTAGTIDQVQYKG